MIHAEVYADGEAADDIAAVTWLALLQAYQLPFEPSPVRRRRRRHVASRLDTIFDEVELVPSFGVAA